MASQIALTDWVSEAKSKKDIQFREAVHIVLHAVGSDAQTAHTLVLKGGILLALKFNSERFTKDIDFTCISEYASFPDVMVQERLNKSLKTSAVILGYSLDCRVQKTELKPDLRKHPNPKFPGLQVNIGYGKKGSLRQGRTYADVLLIDISYNEFLSDDVDLFSDEISVKCYKLEELMAEKFRSILQQVPRNRARRQDVYDLNYLIKNHCKKTDQERGQLTKRKLKHAKGFAVSLVSHQPRSDIPWLAQSGVPVQSEPWSYRSLPVAARCRACHQRPACDPDISHLL